MVCVLLGMEVTLGDACGIWEHLHRFRKVDTGGPTSVRMEYLFASQFWYCKLCVENGWGGGEGGGQKALFC